MIIGIGTDIVEILRIKRAVQRWGGRFLKRLFSDVEIMYCYKKRDPFPCLAGRFAAKEAAIKAFSWFYNSNWKPHPDANKAAPLSFIDIEIINNKSGMPCLNMKNPDFFFDKINHKIHLTISHGKGYATATVVIEMVSNN